jgi:hypothetical protein
MPSRTPWALSRVICRLPKNDCAPAIQIGEIASGVALLACLRRTMLPSLDGLAAERARTGASLEPRDFLLELIDPFHERT